MRPKKYIMRVQMRGDCSFWRYWWNCWPSIMVKSLLRLIFFIFILIIFFCILLG